MAVLSFETLRFALCTGGVQVTFLTMFECIIQKQDLDRISKWQVNANTIAFDNVSDDVAAKKFHQALLKAFHSLKNKLNGKPAVYVHKNSGIPLLGNVAFGILDRGTKTIEVRPITACNIRCVYCSVDEDKRPVDFVVEAEYLAEETKNLIETKGIDGVEILINSQGEPTLYHDMATLVRCLRAIPQVKEISLITNGTLLTHERVDALLAAGLSRVNLSINASTQETARKVADAGYSLKQVHELAKYLADKVELVIAPVWVPGWNDAEMSEIVGFVKSLKNTRFSPRCCIQNFLPYKFGRNPTTQMPWEKFYEKLAELEKKHEIKLTVDASDFPETLTKVGELPKPFKKDDIVIAEILGPGRLEGETLAIAKNRTISLLKYTGVRKGSVKVRITHTKHNIFAGMVV